MSLVDAFARLVQVFVECFTGFVDGHRQERRMVVGCLSFCLAAGGLFELLGLIVWVLRVSDKQILSTLFSGAKM